MLIGILSGILTISVLINVLLILRLKASYKQYKMLMEVLDEILNNKQSVVEALTEYHGFGVSKVTESDDSGTIH